MGVAISITFAQWIAAYPEFTGADSVNFNISYQLAQVLHRNDGGGPVSTGNIQTALLLLMISHLYELQFGPPSQPASPNDPVGRVTSASQGSVSASFQFDANPNEQWYAQTKYGAAYWQASAVYRTMRYIPGPRRPLGSMFFFR